MDGTMVRLDDMAILAKIADTGSLSAAARSLDLPKQTVSRRLIELERALGVQVLHRTTRRLKLTEAGTAFVRGCREIVRIRDDAVLAAVSSNRLPRGLLRITSDVLLGERFIAPLVNEFLLRYPGTKVEFNTTRQFVDLVGEGFDLAFWIGHPGARSFRATSLGPAQLRYCASPDYLERRGRPKNLRDLNGHDCIELIMDEVGPMWPFKAPRGVTWIRTSGRLRTNSYSAMYQATIAGLGISMFPAFAVVEEIRAGRLEPILDELVPQVGSVEMVRPKGCSNSILTDSFANLVQAKFGGVPPWVLPRY